ncbi:MAG TPA: nicotinate phosphoribosyltransferase [Chitinispirillaceae bacterium]|nr:nicotinate phosphoribosyltransferase [Chitinispirillaceae bacterium]
MIISSILDTDLYKLTMQQAVIAQFPFEIVRYELIIRTVREFPDHFADLLKQEVESMSELTITPEEIHFLKETCYFFKPPYLDFLKGYQFDPNEVRIKQRGNSITLIVEGYWYRTILWEIPLMALISELFFKLTKPQTLPEPQLDTLNKTKIERLEHMGARFSDFGTRRRFSIKNHERVVAACVMYAPTCFSGTSNPYLAMKYNCKAIGTQAHEWYMGIAALYGYTNANQIGMEKWVDVYQGDLGVALTDTFTTNVFFNEFSTKYAKLFDGIRQDSGDPIAFALNAINHYEKLRIDPMSKIIVFSDSLDIDRVEQINKFCNGKIKATYGIGTHLTNDVGTRPLNMVIKMVSIKIGQTWVPTVKLSDDHNKYTGSAEAISTCKKILRIDN